MEDKKKTGKMLRESLARAKDRVSSLEDELYYFEQNCKHVWGEVVYDSRIISAYPGTFLEDVKVPRWKRECLICGKIEHTEKMEKIYKEEPKFS